MTDDPELISRREYLLIRAMAAGAMPLAVEAVASVALAHPEWGPARAAHLGRVGGRARRRAGLAATAWLSAPPGRHR